MIITLYKWTSFYIKVYCSTTTQSGLKHDVECVLIGVELSRISKVHTLFLRKYNDIGTTLYVVHCLFKFDNNICVWCNPEALWYTKLATMSLEIKSAKSMGAH